MSIQAHEIVDVRRENDIAIVTINDPERNNAFSAKLWMMLVETFRHLHHEDAETKAIVLTGAGGDFCTGEDPAEMAAANASLLEMRTRIAVGNRVVRTIFTGNKPVIAAIEGCCFGAGMSLAAGCDVAVGSVAAKFSCTFVKQGLLPDTGLLWTLPRKIGAGMARELLLSGEIFDGKEAGRIGLVDKVVGAGDTLDNALDAAARLASFPPITMALLKASLCNSMNTLDDAWRLEMDLNPLTRQTQDHLEAVAAFMEKRKPSFTSN